ncbi:MAG: hypothetical protein KBC98_00405 [Candidatus Pacebacteria bacterium]|nr:hypothetical protein [Candidatus Paceibacterota bacterium]
MEPFIPYFILVVLFILAAGIAIYQYVERKKERSLLHFYRSIFDYEDKQVGTALKDILAPIDKLDSHTIQSLVIFFGHRITAHVLKSVTLQGALDSLAQVTMLAYGSGTLSGGNDRKKIVEGIFEYVILRTNVHVSILLKESLSNVQKTKYSELYTISKSIGVSVDLKNPLHWSSILTLYFRSADVFAEIQQKIEEALMLVSRLDFVKAKQNPDDLDTLLQIYKREYVPKDEKEELNAMLLEIYQEAAKKSCKIDEADAAIIIQNKFRDIGFLPQREDSLTKMVVVKEESSATA